MHRFVRKGGGMGGMNRGDRLVALACSDKGAEMLQRVLDRSAQRLDLTADQQKLYDTFREKALTTETSFADQCQAARPDRSKGRPDLITHLQSQLAIDQARITALNAVLPDFQALFDTLSDQQKAQLRPNLMGMGRNGGKGAWAAMAASPTTGATAMVAATAAPPPDPNPAGSSLDPHCLPAGEPTLARKLPPDPKLAGASP